MTQKQILFKIKGMQRDLSNSSFRSEYAFENMNLRITADTDNGLLSVTNEKGTKELIVSEGYGDLIFNKIYFEDNIVKATYPVGSDVKMECTTEYGTAIVQIKEGETWAGSYNNSDIIRINILTRTDNTYFYGESLAEALFTYDLGYIIGVAEVDNKAVIFHFRENSSYESCITLLSLEDYEGEQFIKATPLYKGSIGRNDLNFSTDHPIETLVDIENENIQKVYWVDGINQPRVINIKGEIAPNDPKQFDFVQEINGGSIEVEHSEASGQFPAGVIQYAFTYFNKFGGESAVVDVSPIYYIAYEDRGAQPDEIVNKSFKITFSDLDKDWDYIRLYSIIRTSVNTTPEVKKVVDLKITDLDTNNYFIDLGSTGEYVAPTDLLYKGGEVLSASTITAKDNTLFLGDINIKSTGIVESEIEEDIKKLNIDTEYKIVPIPDTDLPQYNGEYNSEEIFGEYYQYTNSLNKNSFNLKHFKTNESYRLGVQLQDRYGKWSDPIFIKDDSIVHYPKYIELPQGLHFEGAISVEDAELYLNSDNINATNVYILSQGGDLTASLDGTKEAFEYGDLISVTGRGINEAWYYIGTIEGNPSNLLDQGTRKYYTNIKYSSVGDKGDVLIYYEKTNESTIISDDRGFAKVISYESTTTGERTYSIDVQINNPIGFPSVTNFTVTLTNDNYEVYHLSRDINYWEKLENELNNGEIIGSIANIFEIFKLSNYNISLLQSYTKIRPVIVYPEENEREIICQGVVCPTVFNVGDRIKNSPYAQPSWSWRFNLPTSIIDESVTNNGVNRKSGASGEYKHMAPIRGIGHQAYAEDGDVINYDGEFNIIDDAMGSKGFLASNEDEEPEDRVFGIDSSMVTIHSPEVEFGKSSISTEEVNLRFVGIVPITANVSNIYLTGLYPDPTVSNSNLGPINEVIHSYNKSRYGYRRRIASKSWRDTINVSSSFQDDDVCYWTSYWNNSVRLTYTGTKLGAVISKSRVSNFSFSNASVFFNTFSKIENINSKICDNNSLYLNNKFYFGNNIDKIISGPNSHIAVTIGSDEFVLPLGYYEEYQTNWVIPITYKSNKHIILDLKDYFLSAGNEKYNTLVNKEGYAFWDKEYKKYSSVGPDVSSKYGYLYLVELYREIPKEIKFGGTSEYALQNNLWLPAGKAVNIGEPIIWEEGDTYYQRYDCVKTLPRNDSDLNGITDVLSFMCETRVNLDGRYDDRYKFVEDPLLITSDNINKLNEVYNQSNNFFNYRILDSERFGINNFPNTIVWSKTKQANNIVDNWTNINLASSLDLDGNKGKVTSLKIFNDNIIAFQDKAISQVLFNSRVQLNTSDGVPIEISNSGKVDGKRYLSNNIGCLNKHSICDSTNGIYFIDDYNNSIYLFNGQFNNLSESKGFHSWMKNNSSLDTWDPVNFKNVVTYRDSVNNEILFIYKDKCLVYNEVLGEFSSFYSYEDTPYMFTLNDKNIMYHNGNKNLWIKNEGEYNHFFENYKDFYTTIIANDNPTYDKIFSTLDFRANVLNDNNKMINSTPTAPFNYLKVVNEYQEVESNLSGKSLIPKFRVWRAQFPRLGKNRIRNTWATITLGNLVRNRKGINKKVRLHDMVVNYFV